MELFFIYMGIFLGYAVIIRYSEDSYMNTKQIDCVLELSNTLNFREAAENLFISQLSLTYQIQSLEAEIGSPLTVRIKCSVCLVTIKMTGRKVPGFL